MHLQRFDLEVPVIAAIRTGQRHLKLLRFSILCNGRARAQCKSGPNLLDLPEMAPNSFEIHSQARGPHWIAWVTRAGSDQPDGAIVLVAATREEAEARARRWAEQNT
jgi:hypothetical protein